MSCRFWFLSSSFSGIEPSKCVLQIVPPVLSLNSVTMLKSPPIIVFWLLVMWLVSDWKKFSLWWGLFGPYSVVIWKFCLFNVNVIVIILPALSLTIFCILSLKFSLKRMTTPAEWWVGPEFHYHFHFNFRVPITFDSCCHSVSIVLVEWVSCNNAMSIFLVFRLLKMFIL